MSYFDDHEIIEVIVKCRHATDEVVEFTGDDIVRCKECKYKRINEDGETRYYYCALEDRPNRQWSVDDTDYCSWAEREGE